MADTVVIPVGLLEEDRLFEFVETLRKLTLAEIKVETQFVIRADGYPSVINGLNAMIEAAQHDAVEPKKVRKDRKPKSEPKKRQAWRTWMVRQPDTSTEMWTKGEVSDALRSGALDPRTTVQHPKRGVMLVRGNAGSKQTLVPMPTSD